MITKWVITNNETHDVYGQMPRQKATADEKDARRAEDCFREICECLDGDTVSMRFSLAERLGSSLRGLEIKLKILCATTYELSNIVGADPGELVDVIEGLLANWPATEIIEHYTPHGARAVLQKDVVLTRAAEIVEKYHRLNSNT